MKEGITKGIIPFISFCQLGKEEMVIILSAAKAVLAKAVLWCVFYDFILSCQDSAKQNIPSDLAKTQLPPVPWFVFLSAI
jgi:hypothetical protein